MCVREKSSDEIVYAIQNDIGYGYYMQAGARFAQK